MKIINYIILTAAIATMPLTGAAKTSVKATLDSAYITMGNVTGLTVEIVEPVDAHSQAGFIPETMPREVEIVGEVSCDTSNLDDNVRQITRRIILQSFDSGVYTLPPVFYMNNGDTLFSNTVTLKVNPVDVSQLEDIHGNADTLKVKSYWYDSLPDWLIDYWGWLVLALVIVAGGICAVLIFTKRVKIPFIPQRKPEPPYDMARRRLDSLRQQHLCERGQEREYYTELTDILREYIDKRFDINAMEMTSRQILEHLNRNPETRPSEILMKQILEIADFVKFAKMRPMPEDNVRSFNQAMEFVENTKPQPLPANEDNASTDSKEATPQETTTKNSIKQ